MKKSIKRVLSSVLAFTMAFTSLMAMNVVTASAAAYTNGTHTSDATSEIWDFTSNMPSGSNTTLKKDDTINGIVVAAIGGGANLNKGGYLSTKAATVIAIPVDSSCTSVTSANQSDYTETRSVSLAVNGVATGSSQWLSKTGNKFDITASNLTTIGSKTYVELIFAGGEAKTTSISLTKAAGTVYTFAVDKTGLTLDPAPAGEFTFNPASVTNTTTESTLTYEGDDYTFTPQTVTAEGADASNVKTVALTNDMFTKINYYDVTVNVDATTATNASTLTINGVDHTIAAGSNSALNLSLQDGVYPITLEGKDVDFGDTSDTTFTVDGAATTANVIIQGWPVVPVEMTQYIFGNGNITASTDNFRFTNEIQSAGYMALSKDTGAFRFMTGSEDVKVEFNFCGKGATLSPAAYTDADYTTEYNKFPTHSDSFVVQTLYLKANTEYTIDKVTNGQFKIADLAFAQTVSTVATAVTSDYVFAGVAADKLEDFDTLGIFMAKNTGTGTPVPSDFEHMIYPVASTSTVYDTVDGATAPSELGAKKVFAAKLDTLTAGTYYAVAAGVGKGGVKTFGNVVTITKA